MLTPSMYGEMGRIRAASLRDDARGGRRGRAIRRRRVVGDPDVVPVHREGNNVFAKFVKDADADRRPGDEALVVSPDDELCAVARTAMNRREMLAFRRGVAAFVREGVPPPSSAPPR